MLDNNPKIHECIIGVTERGATVLISSEPSLYEFDQFDGPFLEDNINTQEGRKAIPKGVGVYKCKIMVKDIKFWTDCGYEYDVDIWLEDVVKIDSPK